MDCILYFYHGQSLGHVRRVINLASSLDDHPKISNVILVSGGLLPLSLAEIADYEVIQLPSLKPRPGTLFSGLVPGRLAMPLERVMSMRGKLLDALISEIRPGLMITEFFPFGRARLSHEILSMVSNARQQRGNARVVSSMRDILGLPIQKITREYRSRLDGVVDKYFDEIWVHGDPDLHRIDAELPFLSDKVVYTGYLDSNRRFKPRREISSPVRILVSVGGGKDGVSLARLVLKALPIVKKQVKVQLKITLGPYFDKGTGHDIQAAYKENPEVQIALFEEDLRSELSRSDLSISQCGYNTFLDVVQAGVRAVLVPRLSEPEQVIRAKLLQDIAGFSVLDESIEAPHHMAEAIVDSLQYPRQSFSLNTAGCSNISARIDKLLTH